LLLIWVTFHICLAFAHPSSEAHISISYCGCPWFSVIQFSFCKISWIKLGQLVSIFVINSIGCRTQKLQVMEKTDNSKSLSVQMTCTSSMCFASFMVNTSCKKINSSPWRAYGCQDYTNVNSLGTICSCNFYTPTEEILSIGKHL
jgi:hypothetical protein